MMTRLRKAAASAGLALALVGASAIPAQAATTTWNVDCLIPSIGNVEVGSTDDPLTAAALGVGCAKVGGIAIIRVAV